MGSLEHKSSGLAEAGELRRRRIEGGAAADMGVVAREQVRHALRAGLQNSDQPSAVRQLAEQRLGDLLHRAVQEDDVIGGLCAMPLGKTPLHDGGVCRAGRGNHVGRHAHEIGVRADLIPRAVIDASGKQSAHSGV